MDIKSVLEEPPVLIEQIGYRRALNSALTGGLTHASQLPGHSSPGHSSPGHSSPGHSSPGYEVESDKVTDRVTKIRFAENLQVRFQITSGKKEIIDREQPLIDREKIMLPVSINLMI